MFAFRLFGEYKPFEKLLITFSRVTLNTSFCYFDPFAFSDYLTAMDILGSNIFKEM